MRVCAEIPPGSARAGPQNKWEWASERTSVRPNEEMAALRAPLAQKPGVLGNLRLFNLVVGAERAVQSALPQCAIADRTLHFRRQFSTRRWAKSLSGASGQNCTGKYISVLPSHTRSYYPTVDAVRSWGFRNRLLLIYCITNKAMINLFWFCNTKIATFFYLPP